MTAADWIAEQRRIEQAATEGGWRDAEFVATARTALPRALDALEAVLALWPDADCEVVRAIAEALGVES